MANANRIKLIQKIKEWPRSRQISLAVICLLIIVLFAWIIFQTQKVPYKVLYGNLTKEQASSVVNWLKKQGIPYKIKNQGKNIYVPAGKVYKTKIDLAGEGLPKGRGVGFEIFDKQNFGVTKFTQKVNYQRALQGELARTIAALEPVKSSRVHLVIPEKRLFQEQQKKTKASVLVNIKENQSLTKNQIKGIVHLVAGSIKGLKEKNVIVVDGNGQRLNQQEGDLGDPFSLSRMKYKLAIEKQMEKRAQSLLDRVFSPGNSLVRVTANLDFSQKETTEQIYNPDGIVPRSEKSIVQESSRRSVGGVPGAKSNLNANKTSSEKLPNSKKEEIVNYEISKKINQIKKPIGDLESLSVAVLVAEDIKLPAQGGKSSVPLSQDKLNSIQTMISSALGLSKKRGDQIEVVSMPLKNKPIPGTGVGAKEAGGLSKYLPYTKYVLAFIGLILLYFLLIRPLLRTLQGEVQEHYKTVQELETEYEQKSRESEPIEQLRKEISQSEITPAQVVQTWIKEG